MFKLEEKDLHGIEKWLKWYQEWVRNPKRKYNAKETIAKRKKCKVGEFRDWTFSVERFNEISNFHRDHKIHKTRETKIRQYFAQQGEDLGDMTYEQMIRSKLHRQVYNERQWKGFEKDFKD